MPERAPMQKAGRGPLARLRALRALAEGAMPTLELLADASGRSMRTLRRVAKLEGWQFGGAPEQDAMERVRSLAAGLLDKMEAVQTAVLRHGGRIDKREIEAILALIRGVEKIDEIMRATEAAAESRISKDEDIAATLDRINQRIVTLAMEMAAGMAARGAGPGGGATG